jgi:hypothetical protein
MVALEGSDTRHMMKSSGPWAPKLRPEQQAKLVPDRRGTMLVPTPMVVAQELRRVRRGRLITAAQLRDRLAAQFGAEITCPLTTGIFLNIIAGATEEALVEGRRAIAPWWRVVEPTGALPPKFPPGRARQAEHLRAEGHDVSRQGRVVDVDRALIER